MSEARSELEELRAALAASEQRAAAAEADLARARAVVSTSEAMIAGLKLEIALLKRDKYGRSAERSAKLLDQLELQLGDLIEDAAEDRVQAERKATKVGAFERRKRHCQLADATCCVYRFVMRIPTAMPRLKGYRFPREVVAYAVWAYHRFALSTADVEDLLAERGVTVSRETVRKWVNRFGRHFADCIKRDRPTATDKWHLDEVVGHCQLIFAGLSGVRAVLVMRSFRQHSLPRVRMRRSGRVDMRWQRVDSGGDERRR